MLKSRLSPRAQSKEHRLEKHKIDGPDALASEKEVRTPTLTRLRAVTGVAHQQLEHQLDAVERFSDPARRSDLIQRFAAFHLPAESVLTPFLSDIRELDLAGRSRAVLFPAASRERPLPAFPPPPTAQKPWACCTSWKVQRLAVVSSFEPSALQGSMSPNSLFLIHTDQKPIGNGEVSWSFLRARPQAPGGVLPMHAKAR